MCKTNQNRLRNKRGSTHLTKYPFQIGIEFSEPVTPMLLSEISWSDSMFPFLQYPTVSKKFFFFA